MLRIFVFAALVAAASAAGKGPGMGMPGGVPEFPAELPTREELDKLNKFRAGDYSEIVDALNFNKGAPGSAKKERPLTPGLFEANIKKSIEESINIPHDIFEPIPHLNPENEEHHAKFQELKNMAADHPDYHAKMKEHVAEIQAHFRETHLNRNPHLRAEAQKGEL